jgi:hypothetical protein
VSYGLIGLGAVAVVAGGCGVHSQRNPVSGICECDVGYMWVDPDSATNFDCKPIDISKPCKYPGQQRSPIDLRCLG